MPPRPLEVPPELVAKYDRPGPRYTSYPTVPAWSHDFGVEEWTRALARASEQPELPLAIYVHLPFCHHRCLFCACNVVITQRDDVVRQYLDRLDKEIDAVAARLGERRSVTGVHWGGGTPTHLSCEEIEEVWGMLARRFEVLPEAEVSIEVHPPVTTDEQMRTLRRLGFGRISLGVQDLDDDVQQIVERWQTVEQTERLLDLSRELGFTSVNFDLIYGLPGQTRETWEFTVSETIRMRPDRLAVYSYAKVPWLKPHQKRMSDELLPEPEVKVELLRTARRRLLEAGYQEIGFDHFALPEDELALAVNDRRLYRNFMGYTVRPAPDYVGFGLSAISEIGGCFMQNASKLNRWNEALDGGHCPVERGIVMSQDDRVRKLIIERLTCNLEVRFDEVEKLCGQPFPERFAREWERLAEFESDGLVERGKDRLVITPRGRTFVRNVAMLFDAYLEDQLGDRPIFSQTV